VDCQLLRQFAPVFLIFTPFLYSILVGQGGSSGRSKAGKFAPFLARAAAS